MRSASDDRTAVARIRDAAIEQWGEHGFNVGLRSIAEAAGVSAALVIHHFGSKEGLRKACDDYIAEEIRSGKSASLQTKDPADWFAQMAEIESYAPMMAYLVRSMQSGSDLAKMMWQQDDRQRRGVPGRRCAGRPAQAEPRSAARAKYLGMISGGGFLLYLQMHDNPTDLRAVLRDYGEEMVLPALEIYTEGLMTDSTMYDAFLETREKGIPFTTTKEGEEGNDGSSNRVPAAG